jgi:hypothetical protein
MLMTLAIIACIILCAAGHLFRDGWPPTGGDALPRIGGGFLCGLGVALVVWSAGGSWFIPPAIWGGIAIGFYIDQDHAAGQSASGWSNVLYLTISGLTSMAALAIAAVLIFSPSLEATKWDMGLEVLAVGFAKPPIWFGCWFVNPARFWTFLAPTRVAATIFGAVVGGVLVKLLA